MGFGLFKKIKDFAKKGINWLKGALPKAKKIMDAAAPVVKELPKYVKNDKVKNYLENANDVFDVTNSGIDAINNAVNNLKRTPVRNSAYDDVKNWINYEIKPRLKNH